MGQSEFTSGSAPLDEAGSGSRHEAVMDWVIQAQKGDTEAVSLLYQHHAQQIYRYMAYRLPTPADAEDLTADVFIRMVEGLGGYKPTQVPFEVWLYRIAAARVADFYRQFGRYKPLDLTDFLEDGAPLPEEVLEQDQSVQLLRTALGRLSEEHQTILVLRFVERKSHEEVAAILNKSVTAVKSAQHRALNVLAEHLGTEQKIRHYLRGEHE